MIAIYPGSFDPITFGHVDIIKRLHRFYDKFYVAVANSEDKKYLFNLEERQSLAEKCLAGLDNVQVIAHDGLIVNLAKKMQAEVIVRGLRAVSDYEYEKTMANVNKKLMPEVETLLAFSSPEHIYISSRMVKEVAKLQGNLNGLVPEAVIQALTQKLS